MAQGLARPGVRLFLCARRDAQLSEVAQLCRDRGAEVSQAPVDMRRPAKIAGWVDELWAEAPVDFLIVNAGVYGGRAAVGEMEPQDVITRLIETNLTGAILCATSMAGRMRQAGRGHIALISSLAAKAPSADAPSYSASKAGLTAFGRALREDLAPHGVRVSLVHPGHIQTRQTAQQRGPVPNMIPANDAARRIISGLAAGRGEISFPLVPRLWVRATGLLPWRLQARLNRSLRFTVHNDENIVSR